MWFEGLIQLQELAEGRHNLTVKVVFDYGEPTYPPSQHYNIHTETVSNAYFVIDSSSNDTLHNTSEAPVYLSIIVLVVAIALVSSVSVFYRKRQKTKPAS